MQATLGDRVELLPRRRLARSALHAAFPAMILAGALLAPGAVEAQGPRAQHGPSAHSSAETDAAVERATDPGRWFWRDGSDEAAGTGPAVPPPIVPIVHETEPTGRDSRSQGPVVSAVFDDDGTGDRVSNADGTGYGPSAVFGDSLDEPFLEGGPLPGGVRPYYWQLLPDGLLYKSYLAGEKEPRMSAVWLWETGRGWVWETTLGGRVGLLRNGTLGAVEARGFQLDIEGAVFPRIDPDEGSEMDSVDFRAGCVATWKFDWSLGTTAVKAGYYHISSHIGDEYLLKHPGFPRIEYVRDSLILGATHFLTPDWAVYGEVGYAMGHLGGAQPLEFQFGAQYSPAVANGTRGSPFAAVNAHLREDFDYGGNINVEAGWQWRGPVSDRLFRVGVQYFNGKSLQYQFFDKDEELLGLGMWFDY